MKIKLNKKDVIWSYLGTVFSMASNLLILPFIVHFLDSEMLGLWYVFISLGAVANLFDCGFCITFSRNITYCWSGAKELKKESVCFISEVPPNYYLMKRVIDTCKTIYLIVSIVALIFLSTIGTLYIHYLSANIRDNSFYFAWFIYIFAIFMNLYYGYFSAFLRGVGDIKDANINTVIARLGQICITIICLYLGLGIVGVCSAYLIYGVLFRVLGKRKFYRYQDIGLNIKKVEETTSLAEKKELFLIVWHNAWRDGVITVSDYCCNQISTIFCSLYLNLAETGIYSLGVQLAMAISMIAGTLYTAYQPEIQESYIMEDKERQKKLLSKIVMSFIYIFFICTIGACFIGLPMLRLVKSTIVVPESIFIGLCIYQFILRYRNCYTSYYSCTNRIPYLGSFIFSAILCVIFSYIAMGVLHLGVIGLIIAQIFSQLLFNAWIWSIKIHKELELSPFYIIQNGTKELIEIVYQKIYIKMKKGK